MIWRLIALCVRDSSSLARVKLSFPWLSDDYVTDWARTLHPGAGNSRGFTVLPEVGDEVLVAFEQGDLGRPFVLGGLFNGVDKPPVADDLVVAPAYGRVVHIGAEDEPEILGDAQLNRFRQTDLPLRRPTPLHRTARPSQAAHSPRPICHRPDGPGPLASVDDAGARRGGSP